MAFATITINAEVMIEASTKPEYSLAIKKLLKLLIVGTSPIYLTLRRKVRDSLVIEHLCKCNDVKRHVGFGGIPFWELG